MNEHTNFIQVALQKTAENWHWIAGIGSTFVGFIMYLRHKVKQHYQNPPMRRNDMTECKVELSVGIEENRVAILNVEQKIDDAFTAHNASDRIRTENILMTIAGMQNGRDGG